MGLFIGTAIGVIAGAFAGRVESVLMRLVDVLLAIPSLLLSLTVIILLGFGTVNAAIAVGVASIASFARLARGEVPLPRCSLVRRSWPSRPLASWATAPRRRSRNGAC